ncbi:MAG: PTS sugar transporter subunit IIC/EAL domain-containing protein [Clostridia bacterium]|nr:PTS sugar transporter subunit IIC/EAL domain-containing protein [Clostridia bacterium]
MTNKNRFMKTIGRVEKTTVVRSIRGGLLLVIPVLIIGAFSLILKEFPVDPYKEFISVFAGGMILKLLEIIYSATFGVLSIYMTYSISRAYMKTKSDPDVVSGGAAIASLISFFILAGVNMNGFGSDSTGPKSMFLAVITGLGASALYFFLCRALHSKRRILFSSGADKHFNRMLSCLAPIAITVIVFALFDLAVIHIFKVESFRTLLADFFTGLFANAKKGVGFFDGFFFVLLSSALWFFGIHGSDTLEGVMQECFTPRLALNQAAAVPKEVLTKEFFDCFVLMGGCGATICLLIAILIFSRSPARRGLGLAAAFPMIFNINELMVLGLPIIFNPIMLIPFLTVPLVCYSVSYLALSTGLVPLITHEVTWTTPIILGGLRATGSAAGSVLQLVNVTLGVLIYMPFVRMLDRRAEEEAKNVFSSFMEFFKANEAEFAFSKLTDLADANGDFAKALCAELRHDIDKKKIILAYQPQYNFEGKCVGVEALLRWKHPIHGYLYPPLVIKLAEEGGFLPALEESVISKVIEEHPAVFEKFGDGIKISFNVTGTSVVTDRFLHFCRRLNESFRFKGKNLCLEVTEQTAVAFTPETLKILGELSGMGLLLAIDDFSMGQTSLNYLKDNMFDIIKLDGSLVGGLTTHTNCREIISSIVRLADTLNMTVIAEFVETETERDILHEIGCDCYQGYLYSPAVFLEGDSK